MGNLINPNVSRLGYTYFSDTRWMSFLNCNYSFLLSTDLFLYSYIDWFIKNYRFLMFFYGTDEQRVSHFNIIRHPNGITVILFLRLINFNNRNGNVIKWFLSSVRKFFFKLKNLIRYKEQSLIKLYHKKEVALFSKFKKPKFKIKEIYNPYKNSLFKKPIKKLYQFPFWNDRDFSDIHNQYLSKYDRKDLKLEPVNLKIFPYDQQKLILKNIYYKFGVVKSIKVEAEKKLKFGTGKFTHLNVIKNLFYNKDNKLLWRFYILQILLYMLYIKTVRSQVSFNTLILSSFVYKLSYSIDFIQMLLSNNLIKLKLYLNLYLSSKFNNKNKNLIYYNLLWNNYNTFFDSSQLALSTFANNLKHTNTYWNKRKRKKILKLMNNNVLTESTLKNLGYNVNLVNVFSQKYLYLLMKKNNLTNILDMEDRFKFLHFSPTLNILNNYFLLLFFRFTKLGLVDFEKFYNEYYKLMQIKSGIKSNNLVNIYNNIFNKIDLNSNFTPLISFFKQRILNMQKTFFVYQIVEYSMYKSIKIWVKAFKLGLHYAKVKKYIPSNINLMLLKLSPERLTAPLVNEYIIRNLLIGHSLNRIIYPLINQAYKPFRGNIFCGIKIGCFGRFWRRGRARKVWFNEGSTPLSTISAWVDYKYNFVKLRNGTCSIKVFITYRKVFNYSI